MIAEMIPDLCCYIKTISVRGAQTHLQPRNPLVSDIQERTFLQTAVDSWEENESLFVASLFFFFIFIYYSCVGSLHILQLSPIVQTHTR